MAQSTFQGPIRSLNGLYTQGPGSIVTVGGSTLTVDPALHGGRVLNITAATTTITLPAVNVTADPNSSGPGSDPNTLNNQGVVYTFFVATTATTVKVITAASQYMLGQVITGISATTPAGSIVMYAANGTTIRSLNLNGTTTGGIAGSFFTLTATAANTYMVYGKLIGSGTLATPFATS